MIYLVFLALLACSESQFTQNQAVDKKKETQREPLTGDAKPEDEIDITPSVSIPNVPPNDPKTEKKLEVEFTAAGYQEAQLSYNSDFIELTHELVRERGFLPQSSSYTQVNRPQGSKSFTQGSAGIQVVENFAQGDLGIIDILVVVDNSSSMGQEHTKIANKLPDLISQFAGANWRIRIVSTDASEACNQFALINSDAVNPTQIFSSYVSQLGTSGSGNERGVFKANVGITCAQDPWIRDASNLAILIVSDEDNCANGTCTSGDIRDNPDELKRIMAGPLGNSSTLRQFGTEARIYGIYSVPGIACPDAYYVGNVYYQLIQDSGGYSGSICDADYTSTFQTISQDMKSQLKSTFKLQNVPDVSSLTVKVNNVDWTLGVDYNIAGDTLEFINVPDINASIEASYSYNSTPRYQEFELGLSPGYVESVSIDNSVTTAYQIQGTKIVFNNQPPDNSVIIVNYREANPSLNSEFAIPAEIKDGTLTATVNGTPATVSFKAGGLAVFDPAPSDNAAIVISYEVPYAGEIVNSIPTEKLAGSISDLKAWNAADQSPIEIRIENGNFILNTTGLEEGDIVMIRFNPVGSTEPFVYTLPFKPQIDSLEVKLLDSNGSSTPCNKDQITLNELELSINCKIADIASIDVRFSYPQIGPQTFDTQFADPDKAWWTVTVNGEDVKDFARSGSEITLENLPVEAKVVIVALYPEEE